MQRARQRRNTCMAGRVTRHTAPWSPSVTEDSAARIADCILLGEARCQPGAWCMEMESSGSAFCSSSTVCARMSSGPSHVGILYAQCSTLTLMSRAPPRQARSPCCSICPTPACHVCFAPRKDNLVPDDIVTRSGPPDVHVGGVRDADLASRQSLPAGLHACGVHPQLRAALPRHCCLANSWRGTGGMCVSVGVRNPATDRPHECRSHWCHCGARGE